MAIATPGMAGQTCTLAQVVARLFAHRQPLGAAVAAPRWSVTPAGSPIVEDTMDEAVRAAIAVEVPEIKTAGSLTFGSVKAVAREPDGLIAVADFRRVAGASGW
jgi:gamma-glutamyltranspeptidase